MTVLSIKHHGARIEMTDTGGKISRCFRKGVPYEKALLEHIYQQNFTGLTVDAGANIGNHTLWFAKVCGLQVAAFEPLQYELLRTHVAMNDAEEQVTIYTFGLGDRFGLAAHVGKGRLDPNDVGAPRAGSNEPDVAFGQWAGQGFRAPIQTLDSVGLEGISMIKADVEGMESYVLRGGEQTIKRDRPVVFAETWSSKEHVEIAGVLEPWGYEAVHKFSGKESRTPVVRWDPVP